MNSRACISPLCARYIQNPLDSSRVYTTDLLFVACQLLLRHRIAAQLECFLGVLGHETLHYHPHDTGNMNGDRVSLEHSDPTILTLGASPTELGFKLKILNVSTGV